jgi:hypothetical protein
MVITVKCIECGHVGNCQAECKLFACPVCTLIQPSNTPNCIRISRGEKLWNATFIGPHAAEVVALFGSDTIPTAYGVIVDGELVAQKIGDLNPECYIEIA